MENYKDFFQNWISFISNMFGLEIKQEILTFSGNEINMLLTINNETFSVKVKKEPDNFEITL